MASNGPRPAPSAPAVSGVDPIGVAIRAAHVARVRAGTSRKLADLSERRGRRITASWAMHQSAARRMRVQAAANDAEARRHELAVAALRGLDVAEAV